MSTKGSGKVFTGLGLWRQVPEELPMVEDVFPHADLIDVTIETERETAQRFRVKRSFLA
jgi:hypothetical protein